MMKAVIFLTALLCFFCLASSQQTPTSYFLGAQGDDCYTTCMNENMNCVPHVATGNDTSIFTQLGVNCTPDYDPWWANDQPSYCSDPSDENYGKCVGFVNVPSALFCGGSFPTTRRVCACAKPDSSATFGWGYSNGPMGTDEMVMFTRVLQADDTGVMTHFWVTDQGFPFDNTITIRYYVDGEATASIEFQPALACGTGFDNQTPNEPWGTTWFGKASNSGGWSWNFKVPFQKSIKVTAAMSNPLSDGFYMIVRGGTNAPIVIGDMILPTDAVLHQFTTNQVFAPLDWVTLASIADGPGLFFMHTIAVISGSMNFLEGCYHMYTAETPDFPGVILSTGTEDYFDSAWYFSAGEFRLPVAGFTFFNQTDDAIFWSAYRFHDVDPLQFNDGMQFVWRVGDTLTPTGMKCLSNTGEGTVVGNPTESTVIAYAWVYTWSGASRLKYRY